MEALRELAYPKTHVILLGYNTTTPHTLENAQTTWQEELKEKAAACEITKNAPCILVGTMVATPPATSPLPLCQLLLVLLCRVISGMTRRQLATLLIRM
jgi:GTPase SAR1 family protein